MDDSLARTLLVVACALTAGIHAGLVPEHVREDAVLGVAFAAASVASALVAMWIAAARNVHLPVRAAAVLLAGMIGSYFANRLAPGSDEGFDRLGLATKAVEAGGLWLAWRLRRASIVPARPALLPLVLAVALLSSAFADGHGH